VAVGAVDVNECGCGENAVLDPPDVECVLCSKPAPTQLRAMQERQIGRFHVDLLDLELHRRKRRNYEARMN
jgi:hypothetical protein